MKVCIANECGRSAVARDMCDKHWKRWRSGKNINTPSCKDKTNEQRFWEKVSKKTEAGCWIWTGPTRGNGYYQYGMFFVKGKFHSSHRYSWEMHNGEIPEGGDCRGMCICHRCDTPLCVNPKHLFLGTHKENMQDKKSKGRTTARKTHCINGHERNEKNSYLSKDGLTQCRVCHKLRERNRRKRLASGG